MKIIKQGQHPKIRETIKSLLLPHREDFYFYFLGHVDFYEIDPASVPMPTACVTIINMRMAFCYCREFIESMPQETLTFTVIHEVMHLIDEHLSRGRGYKQKEANIAMDMIINHLIVKHHSVDYLSRPLAAPDDGFVKLDPNYKGALVFEPLYEWLMAENDKRKAGQKHELSPETEKLMDSAEGYSVDFHALPDEVQAEIKKQIVRDAIQKAKIEMAKAGSQAGGYDEVLRTLLQPPKQDKTKLLKRVISSHKGRAKEDSYRRSSRRVPGLKGTKSVATELNILLDTSGSMWGRFEKVLNEIYKDGIVCNIVMVDAAVQKVLKTTSKKQLTALSFGGGGGTSLQPGIDYILNPVNKLKKFPSIILTDGALFESLDFRGSSDWLILSLGDAPIEHRNGTNVKVIELA